MRGNDRCWEGRSYRRYQGVPELWSLSQAERAARALKRLGLRSGIGPLIAGLLSELVDGAAPGGDAFILNSGDAGLLRSLEKLDAREASRSTSGGATIAAHAQHVRYGLSLMNRWSREGASAFANPAWDEPWKISNVDEAAWREIRDGLSGEAQRWSAVLTSPREVTAVEMTGLMSSVAHLAYHLGAIRQINKDARGPKEGTFPNPRDASA